jgi:hypothetical protein
MGDIMTPERSPLFIDFEFDEDGRTIDPISLGIVDLKGRELYIEFDFDPHRVRRNDWVWQNVVPKLGWHADDRLSIPKARKKILDFVQAERHAPEFWAYYASYDWVCWCQLFGRMIDKPSGFPHLCFDLQQWYLQLGRPEGVKPPDPEGEHNALIDARWNAEFYRRLTVYVRTGGAP